MCGHRSPPGLCNLWGSLLPVRHHGGSSWPACQETPTRNNQRSAPCLAQWPDSLRSDPGRNTSHQGAAGSQQRRRKETRWLDAGTMAVGMQCHVGCDICSHTGNILRVAKCAIDGKCHRPRLRIPINFSLQGVCCCSLRPNTPLWRIDMNSHLQYLLLGKLSLAQGVSRSRNTCLKKGSQSQI